MAFQIPHYATQPPQPPYIFQVHQFKPFADYIKQQAEIHNATHQGYRACPTIACYGSDAARRSAIKTAPPAALADYTAGRTAISVTRHFPSTVGGVGIVVSPLQNAAQAQQGLNSWHAVGVLRHGQTLWIQDPSYVQGTQTRLPMIAGTSNVSRLISTNNFGAIHQIQVQGLSDTHARCMARSAQFMDNVIGAPGAMAPYPPNTFIPGILTPGWEIVQRF